ncbi:hypothetical protein ANN_26801 [Periplaneta americana]|uniref:Transposase Tc1-like domain-containing protein n=1 Tax=Periplaneta americana TaxID=6978 RepID=A0ABQ8RZ27_PERAM|nr:hypothetical protein ANN_26801 [Periplaneta americana]
MIQTITPIIKSDHQSEASETSNHHLEPPYDLKPLDEDLSINEKSSYRQCDPQEEIRSSCNIVSELLGLISSYAEELQTGDGNSQRYVAAVLGTRRVFQKIRQVNVSERTVSRRLDECGLNSRRSAKGAELLQQHRVERLRFAVKHANWNLGQWRQVRFTDESRFSLQMDVKECGEEMENVFLHVRPVHVESEERQIRRFKLVVTAIFVIAHIAFIPTHD